MLRFVHGSIFRQNCQVLIHPTNCQGDFSRGISLSFRSHFPEMFVAYRKACRKDGWSKFKLFEWSRDARRPLLVLNVPLRIALDDLVTEDDVSQAMQTLSKRLNQLPAETLVSTPSLGGGGRGLDWEGTKRLFQLHFRDTPVRLTVFAPRFSKSPPIGLHP